MIEQRTAQPQRQKSRKRLLREVYHTKTLTAVARQCPIQMPDSDEFFSLEVAKAAWKEKFREMFHRDRSTEDLSDDEYAALIQQVEAWATFEHAVDFENSDRGALTRNHDKHFEGRP